MATTQYTVRRVPERVARAARARARQEGISLNAVLLDSLAKGLGLAHEPLRHDDLDDLIGTWVEDPEFDRAIREMDRVDPELWA